jgi:hypothetical protein
MEINALPVDTAVYGGVGAVYKSAAVDAQVSEYASSPMSTAMAPNKVPLR